MDRKVYKIYSFYVDTWRSEALSDWQGLKSDMYTLVGPALKFRSRRWEKGKQQGSDPRQRGSDPHQRG